MSMPLPSVTMPPPLYVWPLALQITSNGGSVQTTFRVPDGADLWVKVGSLSIRTGTKMVLESDSARDLITIEIITNDTDQLQSAAFDIWAFRRLNDSLSWTGFPLQGGTNVTIKLTHKPLAGGAAFGTLNSSTNPLDILINLAGYKVKGA